MSDSFPLSTGPLLKIPFVAEILAIGRGTVYELIRKGQLETVHIGRSIRVTSASVETFVDRRQTRSGSNETGT